MEISLNLKNHCIETEIKKQYERLIKQCFNKSVPDDHKSIIETQIEALQLYLNTLISINYEEPIPIFAETMKCRLN